MGGLGVSLTVPGGGGPGGPGGPGGDTTPPVISDVQVVQVTDTTAWITWDTDEVANSNIDYGITESYEIGTESDGTYQLNHSITLSSLAPGTLHYFQVRSSDNNGNQGTSSGYSFTTTDTTAPVISNIEVVDITTSSARVTWETDEAADSYLAYGLDDAYGSEVEEGALETEHSILLTGLDDDTEYHFMVRSTDGFQNSAESSDQTFETLLDEVPANVSNLTVIAGDSQNQLAWDNPTDADLAGIYIVYRTDDYPTSPYDGTAISDDLIESLLHDGLVNGTSYYYGVFAYDLAGQFSSGALGFGMPVAPTVPPVCGDDVCEEGEDAESCPDDCAGGGPVCGDGICEFPEDENNCPADCGDDGGTEYCGDGICQETEDADSCPDDCQAGAPYCGDGVCGQDEDYENCPEDCEYIEELPAGETVPEYDVEFWVASNTIELIPAFEVVDMLGGRALRVLLEAHNLTRTVDHVELVFDNSLFLMSPDIVEEKYVADITTPEDADSYFVSITIFYDDDTGQEFEYQAQINALGYTFELIEGVAERVGGSTVTLFSNTNGSFQVWDGSPYSQLNPITTSEDGTFAWYVPVGDYYVVAEKDEYDQEQSVDLYVTNAIVNPTIEMTLLPPALEEVIEVITEAAPITEKIPEAAAMVVEQIEFVLEEIRETPGVVESAEIAVPVLVGTGVISFSLLALFFNFVPYLQYLFTAPLLFFWRRKRKGWGVVYNAVTKVPVGLAIVRLYKLPDEPIAGVHPTGGRLMQTRVTDKEGRYFFLADTGSYRIEVIKPGLSFPSEFLTGVKDDGIFFDIYHGEPIEVTEQDATIAANIPMSPAGNVGAQTPGRIHLTKMIRGIQKYAAVIGVLVAALVTVIVPSVLSISVAIAQVLLYLFVRHLTRVRKPKGWGIVYDKQTKRPVSGAVVRIFEPKYSKLLETTITDRKGRYSFLVGPNKYYTRYEHKNYKPHEVRPIDMTSSTDLRDIALDVNLEKENKK